jgi:hypothetical protein
MAGLARQHPRHDAQAGPDLEHPVVGPDIGRLDDLLGDAAVDEERLGEALAGPQPKLTQQRGRRGVRQFLFHRSAV